MNIEHVTMDGWLRELLEIPHDAIVDKSLVSDAEMSRNRAAIAERVDAWVGFWMSISDAAKEIGVTDDAVRKAVRSGKLTSLSVRGTRLLSPTDVAFYKHFVKPRGKSRSRVRPGP